ncbi:MAG: CaiB/BaiF CoA transferase family protein [Stackebrandtia sp.]
MAGPLHGVKVVEIASMAPGPFATMVLADLGAEVLRIDRADAATGADPSRPPPEPLGRGCRSVAVDLKRDGGAELALRLIEQADVLVEGFRPGVCERLGIGPDDCAARNPRLVYARITGWGQTGPLAQRAGHDVNYLALSGALHPIGPGDAPPTPPINYVADFGGGGMLLVVGVLSGLLERERSGRGQVVDAAMTEGAGLLSAMLHGHLASGLWREARGVNVLDGSAPFYTTYECADGKFVAVGALEPQFYAALTAGLGLDDLPNQFHVASWPRMRARFAAAFASKSRDEWASLFADVDACVTPVLSPVEASAHPHSAARGSFTEVAGLEQPAPAPRFSRTPGEVASPAPHPGQHTDAALADWGIPVDEVATLRTQGVVA